VTLMVAKERGPSPGKPRVESQIPSGMCPRGPCRLSWMGGRPGARGKIEPEWSRWRASEKEAGEGRGTAGRKEGTAGGHGMADRAEGGRNNVRVAPRRGKRR
jgi:hypothetical protein